MIYFNLGYGNVKTLFKRLNMVGISKEDVLRFTRKVKLQALYFLEGK